ncbi:hypothetical protein FKM82_021622 [Ascaphus truei]
MIIRNDMHTGNRKKPILFTCRKSVRLFLLLFPALEKWQHVYKSGPCVAAAITTGTQCVQMHVCPKRDPFPMLTAFFFFLNTGYKISFSLIKL